MTKPAAQRRKRQQSPAPEKPAEIEVLFVPLWPDAGLALGYKSRSSAHRAAAKGLIEITRFGKLKKVRTRWLQARGDGKAA